jgi:hypothetical protein
MTILLALVQETLRNKLPRNINQKNKSKPTKPDMLRIEPERGEEK